MSHSDFQLQGNQTYLDQLEEKDRTVLRELVSEIGNIRSEKLIYKTYLEAPHYVSRSQIATQILKNAEYKQVSASWNYNQMPCLFTIGYEGLSVDAYLDLLISNNVAVLVDVRKNPLSMKYGFSKTKLSNFAKMGEITYIHIPDLGVPSNLRQNLHSAMDYQHLFDFYSSHILPGCTEALQKLKEVLSDYGRVAITCFEADHRFCHRHKIAEYLENDPSFNTPIIHLQKDCLCSVRDKKQHIQNGLWAENTLYLSV
jgi:hypothetical protein